MEQLLEQVATWSWFPELRAIVVVVAALAVGLVAHALAFRLILRLATATESKVDDLIATHCRGPSRLLFPLVALNLGLPLLALLPRLSRVAKHVVSLGMVIGITWLLIRLARVFVGAVLERYDLSAEDNLESRKMHTQLKVLQRIATVVLVIVGGATALMTFERVRQLGTSILASAGIAGIVLDLPLTAISTMIEVNLRQRLGETDIPALLVPDKHGRLI